MIASHLLIPQLENSFWVVLGRNGVITTKIENGVEREMYMHEFSYMPEFAQTFGDDLTFKLPLLFLGRAGKLNPRHGTSHGLFDYDVFTSSDALYLWWVALRLCLTQELQTATFPQNLKEASAAPIRTTDGANQCAEPPTDAKGSDG